MEFEAARGAPQDLGARINDIAQEAVDAVALSYAEDAGIDVEEHLRLQLSSRGVVASGEDTLARIARDIRAGHPVSIGRHDGSVDS